MIGPDDGLVRLVDAEVEDPRLFVVDPDDGVEMIGHRDILRAIPRIEPSA